jgi:hypothetical protein
MDLEPTEANVRLLMLSITLGDWIEFQRESNSFNEEKVRQEQLKLEVRCINPETEKINKQRQKDWIKHYQEKWPQIQRRSFLLSVCSDIEHELTAFSDAYARTSKSEFRIKDITGKGISKCELLLKRLGVSSSSFEGSWTKLKSIYKIRNRIAHAGTQYDAATFQLAKGLPDIFIPPVNEQDRISLTEDWMHHFAEIITKVLSNLSTIELET